MTPCKHKFGFHNRSAVGYSDVEMGGRSEELGSACGARSAPHGRCDDELLGDDAEKKY